VIEGRETHFFHNILQHSVTIVFAGTFRVESG
jgi:hypothetical protein